MDYELPKRIYFLELIRSVAALYVFVYHILQRIMIDNALLKFLFSFGQEAVILFFVLSGFVIFYSQKDKNVKMNKQNYFFARVIRIYPVFLFALLISYLSVCINQNAMVPINLKLLIENIFMLQDFSIGKPGVWVDTYMGNGPLWSLSYEWWFYILFIPVLFVKPLLQIHLVFGISIISLVIYLFVPNQICLWLAYFLIWWSGVEAAKKYISESLHKPIIPVVYLLFVILLMVFYTIFVFKGQLKFGIFPVLFIRHFGMALIFYSFLIFFNVLKINIQKNNILVRFAPYSYAFYILHYPLLNIFNSKGWLYTSPFSIILLIIGIGILTWIAENVIHKYFSKVLKTLLYKA